LPSNGVPVVRTHREPLINEQGIFGFRIERLVDIDINTAAKYLPEIEKAIDDIHRSGVVRHDISLSNLMLNHEEFIRVIYFGRAGYIGEEVPSYKNKGIKPPANAIFSVDSDKNALKETIGMFSSPKGDLIPRLTILRYYYYYLTLIGWCSHAELLSYTI
jgi:serine/threonine protein kinase